MAFEGEDLSKVYELSAELALKDARRTIDALLLERNALEDELARYKAAYTHWRKELLGELQQQHAADPQWKLLHPWP